MQAVSVLTPPNCCEAAARQADRDDASLPLPLPLLLPLPSLLPLLPLPLLPLLLLSLALLLLLLAGESFDELELGGLELELLFVWLPLLCA